MEKPESAETQKEVSRRTRHGFYSSKTVLAHDQPVDRAEYDLIRHMAVARFHRSYTRARNGLHCLQTRRIGRVPQPNVHPEPEAPLQPVDIKEITENLRNEPETPPDRQPSKLARTTPEMSAAASAKTANSTRTQYPHKNI